MTNTQPPSSGRTQAACSPPRVSHLILAYQQQRYIEEAVRSACDQNYEHLEVIVADDGSTDRTVEIIASLSREYGTRLVALTGGPNLGVTGNSNRALSAARGALISIQGGDDVLLPGKISTQVRWFDQHSEAVLCGHRVENFHDDSPTTWIDAPSAWAGQGADHFVRHGPVFAATAVMVRAAALPACGFDVRLPMVSDWKLWVDALAGGGHFGGIPEVLARYRVHPGGVTQARRAQMMKERFRTLELIEQQHPTLAEAVRHRRAGLHYQRGVEAFAGENFVVARHELLACLKDAPLYSWRVPALIMAASLPAGVREGLLVAKRALQNLIRAR